MTGGVVADGRAVDLGPLDFGALGLGALGLGAAVCLDLGVAGAGVGVGLGLETCTGETAGFGSGSFKGAMKNTSLHSVHFPFFPSMPGLPSNMKWQAGHSNGKLSVVGASIAFWLSVKMCPHPLHMPRVPSSALT